MKFIEDRHIPHVIFVNKIDSAEVRVRDMLAALQSISSRKLVLRQVPIRQPAADGSEETVGYVDLVSERAYRYRSSGASDLIEMPAEILPREFEARREMLETLSEFDDQLLEQLIEDVAPEKSLIYRDLHDEFGADQIAPVLLGAGDRENGVRRLLKTLRHDTPTVAETAGRRTLPSDGAAMAECFKVLHQSHAGKLSLCRVWSGSLVEGQSVGGQRIGTLLRPFGQRLEKVGEVRAGEIVALAKVDALSAGQSLSGAGIAPVADFPVAEPPVFTLSLAARNRNDEVKLSGALHKIVEEDPSLSFEARGETHELLLKGQGEMHLKVAADKLAGRYNVAVETTQPRVAYRETIQAGAQQHARYKRQTGGHGQFADIKVEIGPLAAWRGLPLRRQDRGRRGAAQLHPGGRAGVGRLPEGGSARPAGRRPRSHAVRRPVSCRRQLRDVVQDGGTHRHERGHAQVQAGAAGADPQGHGGSTGRSDAAHPAPDLGPPRPVAGLRHTRRLERWDEVSALMPEAEIADMIVEIRSVTQGVGTFRTEFDHLQELAGRTAERIVEETRRRAAA